MLFMAFENTIKKRLVSNTEKIDFECHNWHMK